MTQPPQPTPFPSTSANLLQAALTLLTEIGGVVASTTELRPILDAVVQKTTALMQADEGSIKLLGADASAPAQTIVRKDRDLGLGSWEMPITMSVMGYLMAKNRPVATPDILDDPEFGGLRNFQSHVRAVLAVPLVVENRITGFLAVTNRTPGRKWRPDEIELMGIVGNNSAVMIEQARLRAEAAEKKRVEEENKRLERELDLARDIQMGLVPAEPVDFGPWEVHGRVVPARQVGGDYFDFFPLGDDRLAITIADVSGKGVPAALLMSNLQATLRAFGDGARSPAAIVKHVNQRMSLASSGGKFVTLFYAEIDRSAQRIRFVNAGHNFPYLRRADGRLETLEIGGLIVGLFPEAEYAEGETAFGAEDALLMFSDGLPEAMDTLGGQFGEERIEPLWRELATATAGEVLARLFDEIERFRGSASQSDDMTAVVVSPRRA
jgi:sigma-B regulation protein RsbU (phosphoserine phosphatase)